MASAVRQFDPYVSVEEHEALERETGEKFEWYDGEVFSMAGARPDHNTIAGNIYASLHSQLRGRPCQPWSSDQQVKIAATRSLLYPDVTIGCPPHEWDEVHRFALTNPSVVVEVLSPGTGDYDRTEKFDLYKRIESLSDYIVVFSDKRRIEHYIRQADGSWNQRVALLTGEDLEIASVNCRLSVDDAYERLNLPVFDLEARPPHSRRDTSGTSGGDDGISRETG